MAVEEDKKSSRNRTITLTEEEKEKYSKLVHVMEGPAALEEVENKTINQDLFEVLDWLPRNCVDLLLDPHTTSTKNSTGLCSNSAPLKLI